jgi:Xaa-Pro aminopeptidase
VSLKIRNRIKKLLKRLAEMEIEAVLISQPENRYYLSGFDGSAGFLLITSKDTILATDFRYLEQAERQAPDYELFHIIGDVKSWFPRLIDGLKLRRLGFEAEHVSFDLHHRLSNILDDSGLQLQLVPVTGLVAPLRAIKEPDELELITKAVAISDAAFEYIASTIHTGMTELEIAWELEKALHEGGSQSMPFEIIVASGPNAALPHAKPSQRTIQSGEPIVFDLGAKVQGYSSDLSRTICLGKKDDTFKKVYQAVKEAQQAAIARITAGITGAEADGLAREVIERAGYGDAFGHGLGHGLGLAAHEQPSLSQNSQDKLVDCMAFTIEPGIYLAGWGGVRIEDTVVMENGKIRLLSQAEK